MFHNSSNEFSGSVVSIWKIFLVGVRPLHQGKLPLSFEPTMPLTSHVAIYLYARSQTYLANSSLNSSRQSDANMCLQIRTSLIQIMACRLSGTRAIMRTNADILSTGPSGTSFNELLIETRTFSCKKIHLKMSSANWRPFCLNVLSCISATGIF